MNDNSKVEIVFAPGCFDNFEGTQEELDEFVAELNRLVETGELFDRARPIDIDEISDSDSELLERALTNYDPRKLQ
jgi:hypothetical protein